MAKPRKARKKARKGSKQQKITEISTRKLYQRQRSVDPQYEAIHAEIDRRKARVRKAGG